MRSHRCFPRPYGINRFPKPFSRLFVVRWRNRFDEVWRRLESLLVWRDYLRNAEFRWSRWRGPRSALISSVVSGHVPHAVSILLGKRKTFRQFTTVLSPHVNT